MKGAVSLGKHTITLTALGVVMTNWFLTVYRTPSGAFFVRDKGRRVPVIQKADGTFHWPTKVTQ